MPAFLTFALVAPIASFGGVAVGERRGGWDRPARSAVLGLLGACLGVEREDDVGQAALATDYNLALLCHAPGRLLADYHTAQVPPAARNRRFATRTEGLSSRDLNTVLSRRDYRTGAWHLGALWPRGEAPRWTLEELAAAMERPVFTPSLGRKSCPLGLPLAPWIKEAPDAPAALMRRHREGPETALIDSWSKAERAGTKERSPTWPEGWSPARFNRPLRDRLADEPAAVPVIAMDAAELAEDDARRIRTETRRDQPRTRRRTWQFDLRAEAVLRAEAP
ncbi:type I-E CRISPR-associated protein Cas5/CasD [Roseomonas xinghualingensis]|uniref:type I-E CRISPR-associated protein Cas5/CasD n=1 Tax=Roseomonas xinghualingensis TaxID=2986475 RepID=UPI0021F203FA|nr:type I-E CRISPR-associated protein Cas5/CasD [Roseomonas sp. SXEYE001]MCV4210333.1 type I-E CRISPR-associated protein Cas5/CasD [Roseomonas sp. SXEYE001]